MVFYPSGWWGLSGGGSGSGGCYDIDLELLSLIVSLISVFAGFPYCTMLVSLILKIHTYTPRMHSYTPMISLCLLLHIAPRFPSLLILFFPYEFPLLLLNQENTQ